MIWVTWRQHRTQALICLGLFCAISIFAVALGTWMRATFSTDGLGTCLARSGGAGCPAAINSFVTKFNGGVTLPVNLLTFVIPGYLGAIVGAPLLGQELERVRGAGAAEHFQDRNRGVLTAGGIGRASCRERVLACV